MTSTWKDLCWRICLLKVVGDIPMCPLSPYFRNHHLPAHAGGHMYRRDHVLCVAFMARVFRVRSFGCIRRGGKERSLDRSLISFVVIFFMPLTAWLQLCW